MLTLNCRRVLKTSLQNLTLHCFMNSRNKLLSKFHLTPRSLKKHMTQSRLWQYWLWSFWSSWAKYKIQCSVLFGGINNNKVYKSRYFAKSKTLSSSNKSTHVSPGKFILPYTTFNSRAVGWVYRHACQSYQVMKK